MSERQKKCVAAYNGMIKKFNFITEYEMIPMSTSSNNGIKDVNPQFFVDLFESLFLTKVPGIYRGTGQSKSIERSQRVHNLQIILETLGEKIIHLPLDHIKADNLEDRDEESLMNIIEIFDILSEQTRLARSRQQQRSTASSVKNDDKSTTTSSEASGKKAVSFNNIVQQVQQQEQSSETKTVEELEAKPSKPQKTILGEMSQHLQHHVDEIYDISFDAKGKGRSKERIAGSTSIAKQSSSKKETTLRKPSARLTSDQQNMLNARKRVMQLYSRIASKYKSKKKKPDAKVSTKLVPSKTPQSEALRCRLDLLKKQRAHIKSNPVLKLSSLYRNPFQSKHGNPGKPKNTKSKVLSTLEKLYKQKSQEGAGINAIQESASPGLPNDPLNNIKRFLRQSFPGITIPRHLENQMHHNLMIKTRISENATRRERQQSQRQNKIAEQEARLNQVSNLYKRDYAKYLESARKKSVVEAKRLQTIQYNERKRALVRMVKYNEEIQNAVVSRGLRKKAQEEAILTQIVKDLQKTEREILVERHKTNKDLDSDLQKKLTFKRESLENYFRDQCEILNEEIKEVRRDQEIAEKDKIQAIRRYYREQKGIAKRQIQLLKDQLQHDQDDNYFRELDVESIRRDFAKQAKSLLL